MSFEQEFKKWLDASLANPVSRSVKAFSFNLFELSESAGSKFGIELIGADDFDEDDSDWACAEVWEPEERWLGIPVGFSGTDWEPCLGKLKELLLSSPQSGPSAEKLKSRLGVGLGFVDGDLEVLWQR